MLVTDKTNLFTKILFLLVFGIVLTCGYAEEKGMVEEINNNPLVRYINNQTKGIIVFIVSEDQIYLTLGKHLVEGEPLINEINKTNLNGLSEKVNKLLSKDISYVYIGAKKDIYYGLVFEIYGIIWKTLSENETGGDISYAFLPPSYGEEGKSRVRVTNWKF